MMVIPIIDDMNGKRLCLGSWHMTSDEEKSNFEDEVNKMIEIRVGLYTIMTAI